MVKYAIIVDPFSSGALYAKELIKAKVRPIAVLSQYPILDIYSGSFVRDDFDVIFVYKNNINKLNKELQEFLNKNNLALVLAGAECGVELADIISEQFCPNSSNGTRLSRCRRNKYNMAERLEAFGVKIPLYIKATSVDEVIAWSYKHALVSKGVVIKPLDSAGTDGVIVCSGEQEIKVAVENNLGKINKFNRINKAILAQEFLNGVEYVVDTVSKNGQHIVTNFCRYKKTQVNGSRFVYDHVDFLSEDGYVQKTLANYTFNVLDGLGIKNGPAHSEIIHTSRGPRLIETGARMHGGIAIPACRIATGSSQLDYTLNLFLNNISLAENKIGFHLQKQVRIVLLISHFEGVISGFSKNLENIENLQSVNLIKLNVQPGGSLKRTVDLFTTPGLIILCHDSPEQIKLDYQWIRKFEKEGLFTLEKPNTQIIFSKSHQEKSITTFPERLRSKL